jgi:hypothetical protein
LVLNSTAVRYVISSGFLYVRARRGRIIIRGFALGRGVFAKCKGDGFNVNSVFLGFVYVIIYTFSTDGGKILSG